METAASGGTNLWEVLAGRAPGRPSDPDDPDLWRAVVERLDPARARPRLRSGIEEARLTSVRGYDYVMLRSPDREAAYVRLAPEEVELAHRMDGRRTVAQLVGEFARLSGRLAPQQVTRVVADLAANRMLTELPLDAFHGLGRVRRRPGGGVLRNVLAAARGRRIVLADFDGVAGFLYRAGGRWLFTRGFAAVAIVLIAVGLGLFGWTWLAGGSQLFVERGSYATGGLVLLGLNVVALAAHELGHALAVKHAGRRVPAIGFLFYFGIPSMFVDTTDVWMADRRARMLTTAAGPLSALTLAGAVQLVGVAVPELGAVAFRLAFAWYLNALFNLNPLMALDGYYLAMDWLEIPNLRARGIASLLQRVRGPRMRWTDLDREGRMVALYGTAAALWTLGFAGLSVRMWRDRISGLVAGLWHAGTVPRLLLIAFVVGLFAPMVHGLVRWSGRRVRRLAEHRRERDRVRDAPARLDALRASRLGQLPPALLGGLADEATWWRPGPGRQVQAAGAGASALLVVVDGALEGRRPGDPPGTVRARVSAGGLVGVREVLAGGASPLAWHAAGTRLLSIPAASVARSLTGIVRPPGPDREEAEAALDAVPALRHLDGEQRETVLAGMQPVDVDPGRSVTLPDPDRPAIVVAGVVATVGGLELRRGDLIRATSADEPFRGVARSRVRLWSLAPLSAVGPFGPAPVPPPRGASEGAHGGDAYVPLAAPPTPEPPPTDDDEDDRLILWFRRLLLLLLLLVVIALLGALPTGSVWAEVPDGYAVLTVREGPVTVTSPAGRVEVLGTRARDVLPVGGGIDVPRDSVAELTFAGGGQVLVCGGSRARLDEASRVPVPDERPVGRFQPVGRLRLERGRVLADSASHGVLVQPLRLSIDTGRTVASTGRAHYSADASGAGVASGEVEVDGRRVAVTGLRECGGPASDADPSPSPADTTTRATASPTARASTSGSPSPTTSPSPSPSTGTPSRSPTPRPTSSTTLATPTTTPSATPTPPSPPPTVTATTPSPTPTTTTSSATPTPTSPTPTSPTPSSPTPSSPTPSSPPPTPVGTFAVSCPSSHQVQSGSTGQTSCTVTADKDFAGTVSLTCSGELPCDVKPASVTLSPGQTVTLAITIDATAASAGTQHTITVTGTSGAQKRSAPIVVFVV